MSELSIFIDESGDAGRTSDFYLLTLVFHEQDRDISGIIAAYELSIGNALLDAIPFHFNPLLNGNDDYKWKGLRNRKKQLSAFAIFAQRLPISYATFAYEKQRAGYRPDKLARHIEADVRSFLEEHLAYLQRFDDVKIYYDDGQSLVTKAIHSAIEKVVSKQATVYKDATPERYRLFQVADYLCGVELTELKYRTRKETKTDREFFGNHGAFKHNFLKKIRKKRLN